MTKVVSLVRLVPTQRGNLSSRSYLAQYKLPEEADWVTIGTLTIENSEYLWEPLASNTEFEDIEVSSRDLYSDFESRFNPVLFARYKIKKFAKEIAEGEWPPDTVVPPGLANEYL